MSTTSPAVASTSAASSAMATTPIAEIPTGLQQLKQSLSNLLPVKLDESNYVLWKVQMEVALQGHGLYGYISGDAPAPLITSSTGVSTPNPAFLSWQLVDQQLKSCLFASITTPVLAQVIKLPTASSLWTALAHRFSSHSRSHMNQLKEELQTITKGSQSMQTYLDNIKHISDNLAAAAEVISDEDLVLYTLRGLPYEFDSFKTSIRTRPYPITMQELCSLLITEELHKSRPKQSPLSSPVSQDLHTALYSNYMANQSSSGKGRGKGNGFKLGRGGRTHRGQGRGVLGPFPTPIQSSPNPSLQSFPSPFASSTNPTLPAKTYCQICSKPNHTALDCWHRLDTANYAGTKPPKQAFHTQFYPPNPPSPFWYLDSGANTHVTHDLGQLQLTHPPTEHETVAVGNGQTLPVHQIGNGTLHTPSSSLLLNNILYVPQISSNLLSVYQLTKANDCSVIFTAKDVTILDNSTKK